MSYKVLGQSAPAATTSVDLYTVPASKEVVVSNIFVANRAATDATFRVAVVPSGGTLGNEHYLAYDVTVAANDTTQISSGITGEAGDVIKIYASSADLSFSVFGTEVDA